MTMKWAILLWPLLAATSPIRNVRVESIAIVHALVASYAAWGVITGIWSLPGTWERSGISVYTNGTQWYGWFLWAASVVVAMLAWIDRDIRLDRYSDARFPARHRQLSYVIAVFGIFLLAYSGGYFYIPLGVSGLFALGAFSGGIDIQSEKMSSN